MTDETGTLTGLEAGQIPEGTDGSLPIPEELAPSGGGHVAEHTREAVARMVVQGATTAAMAAATGRDPETIKGLLKTGDMAARVEAIRGLHLRAFVGHWFDMLEFHADVKACFARTLGSTDERLAWDAAKWWNERFMPPQAQKLEVDLSGTVEHDVTGALEGIGKALAALAEARSGQPGFASRVKTGAAALPRPSLAVVGEPPDDAA